MEGDEIVNTVSDIVSDDGDEYLDYDDQHEYHDFSKDYAATKMHHLMHSAQWHVLPHLLLRV